MMYIELTKTIKRFEPIKRPTGKVIRTTLVEEFPGKD